MGTYEYGGKRYSTREAARAASRADKAKNSGPTSAPSPTNKPSGSSGSNKPSSGGGSVGTDAQRAQLDQIKQTLLRMSADVSAGRVTGLAPSTGGGSAPKVTQPNANTINAGYAAALAAKPTAPTPTVSSGSTYTVKSGDTLSAIASRSGMSLQTLLAQNPEYQSNPNLIVPGQTVRLNTNQSVPTTALTNNQGYSDVLDKQKQLEQILLGTQDVLKSFAEMTAFTETPFMAENKVKNYDKIISDYVTGRTPETGTQREFDRTYRNMERETKNYYQNRESSIAKAYDEFGVEEKNNNLARVQKEMAEREVRMREDLKAMETSPEFRGVDRQFANDQATAIREQGTFELANMAIIESAYKGDLDRAEKLAERLIDAQYEEYQGKIAAYKMRLQALEPKLNQEQKQQALQLELALDQRDREIQDAKNERALIMDYMTTAAQSGADLDTVRTIMNSKTADEAFLLAAPYMAKKNTTGGTTSGGYTQEVTPSGVTYPAGNINPYNTNQGLNSLNMTKATAQQIQDAIRSTFAPAFASKLLNTLTGTKLEDFLARYKADQQKLGMNIDPEQYLKYYLEETGASSSGGRSV